MDKALVRDELGQNNDRSKDWMQKASSRLPGFYELPIGERQELIRSLCHLSKADLRQLSNMGSLNAELVDVFIENAVGTFALPLGIATNFIINGVETLIPMAVEETSVVAAASHGAKLARSSGGFKTSSTDPIMIGQVQLVIAEDVPFDQILEKNREMLLEHVNRGQDRLLARGGGAKDIQWRYFSDEKMLVIHVLVDTREAMGANMVNTMAERLSQVMPELFECQIGLRILSNLSDQRRAKASCRIRPEALQTAEFDGHQLIERIVQAYRFAACDIYRATTHNKGVMNGIDPVLIATGNDWRAIEAGAHAYCCRFGRYSPMTSWWIDEQGCLAGELELPMAVGVVGGVTKLHPSSQAALKVMGMPSARQLAEIVVAVGLAQNLSALRALASEGIQRGHMSLHAKNLDLMDRQGASKT